VSTPSGYPRRYEQRQEETSVNVTAKIKVTDVRREGGGTNLSFGPDYDQNGKNQAWADATPYLDFRMKVNGEVADHFELGQSFTVTFEPEAAQAGEQSPEYAGQPGDSVADAQAGEGAASQQ